MLVAERETPVAEQEAVAPISHDDSTVAEPIIDLDPALTVQTEFLSGSITRTYFGTTGADGLIPLGGLAPEGPQAATTVPCTVTVTARFGCFTQGRWCPKNPPTPRCSTFLFFC